MKVNGIEYIIENINGSKFYYKVVNNQKVELTSKELENLLKDLTKMQQIEKIKEDIINKINNNSLRSIEQVEAYIDLLNVKEYKEKILSDIKDILTINQIKRSILEQIKSKQIKNYDELKEYIEKYNLINNKDELLKYGKEELDRINLGLTPAEELKHFILEEYKKAASIDAMFRINLKASGSVNNKYFEISLVTERDNQSFQYPKNYYVRFDDEVTEKLINPILREVSLKGILNNDYIKDQNDVINNRYNYHLQNNKKCSFNVSNIEEFYADKLKQEAIKVEKEYGKNNDEEVSKQVEDENNLNMYNEELEKEFTHEEIEEMKRENMTPESYRELHKSGPKLVRTKPENKGFSIALPIFVITEFFAVLFILMQIILL